MFAALAWSRWHDLVVASELRAAERREWRRGRERRRAYMQYERDATRAAYREAYGHARAIVDASKMSTHGYWAAEKVPAEPEAMVAAISRKMRIDDGMGYRRVHPTTIADAVGAVLEGRQPKV